MSYLKLSFKSGVLNINNLPILMVGAAILTAALLFPINSAKAQTFQVTIDASALDCDRSWALGVTGVVEGLCAVPKGGD